MPTSREIYQQHQAREAAAKREEERRLAQQRNEAEIQWRQQEQKRAAEEKARAEAIRLKRERNKQTLSSFGVKQELNGLKGVVKGPARVVEEKYIGGGPDTGGGLVLEFNEIKTTDIYGPNVYNKEVLYQERVEVYVVFNDQNQPTALSVNGKLVTTKDELQQAIADSAINPRKVGSEPSREVKHYDIPMDAEWSNNSKMFNG